MSAITVVRSARLTEEDFSEKCVPHWCWPMLLGSWNHIAADFIELILDLSEEISSLSSLTPFAPADLLPSAIRRCRPKQDVYSLRRSVILELN